jgi:diguanylate cyclase (GGDEF)-like protein
VDAAAPIAQRTAIDPVRPALRWLAFPLWLMAFGAAALMEYAPFTSLWFPPTAVTFAAIAVFGRRGWLPVALAALASQAWTMARMDLPWTAMNLFGGGFGFVLAHTLPFAALAVAWRALARRDPLGRYGPTPVFALLGGGALASLAAAAGGNAVLLLTGQAVAIDLRAQVVPWMIGDYSGLLALGPLLVELLRRSADGASVARPRMAGFLPRLGLLLGLIAGILGLAALAPGDDAIVFALCFALVAQQWISHTYPPLQSLAALAAAAVTIAVLTKLLGLGHHALTLQFAVVALALSSYSALALLGLRTDNERLQHLLSTDPLTAAASRQQFARSTESAIEAARRDGRALSLLMLDLDHLKRVNDSLGHAAGDEVLRRFALLCRGHLRPGDLLGRLGGDEFAICLPGLDAGAALRRAEALLADLAGASTADAPLGASAGVAALEDDERFASLMHRADQALIRAKRDGRGRALRA